MPEPTFDPALPQPAPTNPDKARRPLRFASDAGSDHLRSWRTQGVEFLTLTPRGGI